MDKARVESFSDGVFAFAITLLVLAVQVPAVKPEDDVALRTALLHSFSQLLPYVTSFAAIGIIWLNHHSMFNSVQRVDHATLTLNLLLLLVVVFIPYPTAVLSRYGALPSSAFLYGLVLTVLGISYSILVWYLEKTELFPPVAKLHPSHFLVWRNLVGSLGYPAATLSPLCIRESAWQSISPSLSSISFQLARGDKRLRRPTWVGRMHLTQDTRGAFYLQFLQGKMKREHTIPVSQEIARVVQEQHQVVRAAGNATTLLFPSSKSRVIKQQSFSQRINRLAFDHQIRDANGKLFRFQSHQFRHTVGTRMINLGV